MKKVLIKETKNPFAWHKASAGKTVEVEKFSSEGHAFPTAEGYLELTGKPLKPGLGAFIPKGEYEHAYDIQVTGVPDNTPPEVKDILLGGIFEAVQSDFRPDSFDFWARENIYVTIPRQFCKIIDPPVEQAPKFKHRVRVFDLVYNKDYKDIAGMEIDVFLDSDRQINTNNPLCVKHPLTKLGVTLQPGDYMLVNAKNNLSSLGDTVKTGKIIPDLPAPETESQEIANHIKELIDTHEKDGDLFGVVYFQDKKGTVTPGLQKAYRNLCKEAELAGYKAQLTFNTGEGQSAVFEGRKPVGIVTGGPHHGKVYFNDGTVGEAQENPAYTGLWSPSKIYTKGQQFLKSGVFYETIVDSAPGDSTKRSFARIPGAITPSGYVASEGEINNITEAQGQQMADALKSNLEGAKEIDKVSAFRAWMDKATNEAMEEIKKYNEAFPNKLATNLITKAIVDDLMKEFYRRFNDAFGTGRSAGKQYSQDLLKPFFKSYSELLGRDVYRVGIDIANGPSESVAMALKKVGDTWAIQGWINSEKPFCQSFLDEMLGYGNKIVDRARLYGNPTEYVYRGGFRSEEKYNFGDICLYKGVYYQKYNKPTIHGVTEIKCDKDVTPDKLPWWRALPDQNFTPDPAKKFIVEVNTNAKSLKNYLLRRQKQLRRAIGKYSNAGRPTPDYLKAELNEIEVQLIPKDGK